MKKPAKKRRILIFTGLVLVLFLILVGGYAGWNAASPERSCASCHEIVPSTEIWKQSAHREVACSDCHGTALGNGIHSLKEKSSMVFSHMGNKKKSEDIRLNEAGVLEVMEACIKCHRDEYASWQAGGHSATYADIFLNEKHNAKERPYPDCFRCHGMYYDGSIADLVEPISTAGPWSLRQAEKASQPVIPCLACHPIHMENSTLAHPESMDDPYAIFYEREERNP